MAETEDIPTSSSSSDSGVGGIDHRKRRSLGEQEEFDLPDNWPDYDFHRKKSCLLSRIFSTCITKAINHLELVQDAVEQQQQVQPKRREVSFGSATFSTSDKLEVIGSSGRIPSAQKSHHEILENEIIEEVLMLLARLDHERLRLMNSCERERENRERLKNNIDQWRLKRLHDLPLAVQKEHDACVTDITELQWHMAYNARLIEKILSKIELSQIWHRQLEIEVNDIRQTIPLITEKAQTEVVEIKRIDEALKETEHELLLSRTKNADTLEKSTKANQRATTEREEIRGEIDKASKNLQKMAVRLETSVDQHKTYEKTIADAKETVKKNDRAYNSEVKKRDASRGEVASLKLKLMTIAQDRERMQLQIARLREEFDKLKLEEEEREFERKRELDGIQVNVSKREEKLDKLIKKQREKTTSIDEDERRLDKIRTQIDRDKKNLSRFHEQRARDSEMLRTITENLQRAFYTNDSISTDMKRETEKLKKEEDEIRNTMESVRRQIHDESTMIVLLDKHLDTDQRELDLLNDHETHRAENAERVATDLQGRCDLLTETVATMESTEESRRKTLGQLRHELLDTNESYVQEKDTLTKERDRFENEHRIASERASELESKVNYMIENTKRMHKENVEMTESREVMENKTVKLRDDIEKSEYYLTDVNYNLSLVTAGEEEVTQILQQCIQRQNASEQVNRDLYRERSDYLSDKKVSIEKALVYNKKLASLYRDVLYTYQEQKGRLMTKLEQRLDAVARVKDTRQLIELQSRLHNALSLYFGIKNEFIGQRLKELNKSSQQNARQLTSVQETVQSAVDYVTKFLHDQVDFEAIHRQAMLKVHKEELQEQQKASILV